MILKEYIERQLTNYGFANAMDITSFLVDGIIFSEQIDSTLWLKYCRLIIPHSGYRVEFTHPYKSRNLKDITQYDIFADDKHIIGSVSSNEISAETQAYIKVSQLSTFKEYFDKKYKELREIFIDLNYNDVLVFRQTWRYYRVSSELSEFLKDKTRVRDWKLSKIDI